MIAGVTPAVQHATENHPLRSRFRACAIVDAGAGAVGRWPPISWVDDPLEDGSRRR